MQTRIHLYTRLTCMPSAFLYSYMQTRAHRFPQCIAVCYITPRFAVQSHYIWLVMCVFKTRASRNAGQKEGDIKLLNPLPIQTSSKWLNIPRRVHQHMQQLIDITCVVICLKQLDSSRHESRALCMTFECFDSTAGPTTDD